MSLSLRDSNGSSPVPETDGCRFPSGFISRYSDFGFVRAVAFWACVGLPVGLPLVNHPNKVLGVELPGGHVCQHGFEHMAQLRS